MQRTLCVLLLLMATSAAETARTAPVGRFAFGCATGLAQITSSADSVLFVINPNATLTARLGVASNLELGALWAGGRMTLAGKFCFTRGAFDAAVATSASLYSVSGTPEWRVLRYSIDPYLIISKESEGALPLSAKAGLGFSGAFDDRYAPYSIANNELSVSAGLGLPFRIGEHRKVRVMPELALSLPLLSVSERDDTLATKSMLGDFSIGLGVNFSSVP